MSPASGRPYLGNIHFSLGAEVRAIAPIAFAEQNGALRMPFQRQGAHERSNSDLAGACDANACQHPADLEKPQDIERQQQRVKNSNGPQSEREPVFKERHVACTASCRRAWWGMEARATAHAAIADRLARAHPQELALLCVGGRSTPSTRSATICAGEASCAPRTSGSA